MSNKLEQTPGQSPDPATTPAAAPTPAPPPASRNPAAAEMSAAPPEVQRHIRQGGQVQTTRDLGFEIPVETIPLPSGGKIYPEGSSLHNRDTLEIRAMTAREEDILTSRALIRKGTVISHLIRSCLIDKSVDPDRLISGDRDALMVSIRITGYGSDYQADVECPRCNENVRADFQLAELPIKRLELEPVEPGRNLFEVDLPISRAKVKFSFLTGDQQNDLLSQSERKRKSGLQADSLVTSRLQVSIVSVNGKTDQPTINHFVRNMPARDSLFLRKYMDDNEPGLDMRAWFECDSCGEESRVALPLGVNFFWPGTE